MILAAAILSDGNIFVYDIETNLILTRFSNLGVGCMNLHLDQKNLSEMYLEQK